MTTATAPRGGARVAVQKFGTFLSGMIMPNIAAFIAWGFITSLFIEKGWTPVAQLGGWGENPDAPLTPKMIADPNNLGAMIADPSGALIHQSYGGLVGPMITYLLPLLIAAQGGRMVYNVRGAVVGSIAVMGVIAGTSSPMFLGAMIVGPLAAWLTGSGRGSMAKSSDSRRGTSRGSVVVTSRLRNAAAWAEPGAACSA